MSDDEFHRVTEIERVASGKPTHFAMDEAFSARMHAAIAAGLESAPTSGDQNADTPMMDDGGEDFLAP
jgi:hypothetical protein